MESCRVSLDEIANDRPTGDYARAHRQKIAELMGGMFDPMSNDNFACFFTADLSNKQMTTLFAMRDALKAGQAVTAAALFQEALTSFYYGLAHSEAFDRLLNAHCRHCYDMGCPKCNELEIE